MSEDNISALREMHLLGDLSDSALEAFAKSCAWRRYDAGEQIIDRQAENRSVYFVADGKIRISVISLQGREITLEDLGKGTQFGELAAIDAEPRSATATALTSSYLAVLSHERFLELCAEHPSVSMKLLRWLTNIVRSSTERIVDLSTLAANNRVHAEILRQSRDNMTGDNAAEISPIPVHSDIASRVSTTRETVARVMSDLARDGIVVRGKKALVVPDVERLEIMVEDVRG